MSDVRRTWMFPFAVVAAVVMPRTAGAAPVEVEIEDEDAPATAPPVTEASPDSAARDPDAPDPSALVEAPTTAPATTPATTPEPDATAETIAAMQAELAAMRARLAAVESRTQPAAAETPRKPAPVPAPAELDPPYFGSIGFGRSTDGRFGLRVSGYVQVQYQHNQLSEDQLQQGGVVLNRDRFMVRRGRVRVSGDWQYFAAEVEVDGSTTRGPFIGIRQAHVSALWRHRDRRRPPYVMLTAGLTEVPFGYEVRLGQREMPFMERTGGSLAFFPGPVDVGLRLRGGLGPLRYDFAVMNGTPLDDRAGGPAGLDPTRKPDFAGRVGFEVVRPKLAISGGASFLAGTGFHAGHDASKNDVEWHDLNGNGTLDTGELVAVPGAAALPSVNFRRWAANVDLQFGVRSKAGWTRIFGEATLAANLDRGQWISDPVAFGADQRQIQGYAAVVQDATRWAMVGLRYDYYDGNADLLDRRRGTFVPANTGTSTFSPMIGAVLPAGVVRGFRGRLVLQYDAIVDTMGRDRRGVPTDLRNDQITVRLQGEF